MGRRRRRRLAEAHHTQQQRQSGLPLGVAGAQLQFVLITDRPALVTLSTSCRPARRGDDDDDATNKRPATDRRRPAGHRHPASTQQRRLAVSSQLGVNDLPRVVVRSRALAGDRTRATS